jgi:small subunit ribosomal protein S14
MVKYLTVKDFYRRKYFDYYESEKLRLKSIIYNRTLPSSIRLMYSLKLSALPRNASQVRIKNRCLITHRGQSVYRFFKLSRISLKEFVGKNYFLGIGRSSW